MLIIPGQVIAYQAMLTGEPIDELIRDECFVDDVVRVLWPKS